MEIITFTMTPLMDKKHAEKRLDEVIPLLLKIIQPSNSIKDLSYGITWLLVDKFITDDEKRTILQDRLGGRMSAIYEYGQRKEKKGIEKGMRKGADTTIEILSLYKKGVEIKNIAEILKINLKEVERIINKSKNFL